MVTCALVAGAVAGSTPPEVPEKRSGNTVLVATLSPNEVEAVLIIETSSMKVMCDLALIPRQQHTGGLLIKGYTTPELLARSSTSTRNS